MKATVVRAFGEPLVIEDRPEPGPGQVRVRVEASGLCHTGIHAATATGRSSRPRPETRPPAAVDESIAEVLRGEVRARIVFDLGTGR